MGIRFFCPNGHKLNIKSFLAGKRGKCPNCDARFLIPLESTDGRVAALQKETVLPDATSPVAAGMEPESNQHSDVSLPVPEATNSSIQHDAIGQLGDVDIPPSAIPLGDPRQHKDPDIPINDSDQGEHHEPLGDSPDPILESPHAVWYVRPASGGQFGPATGDIMRNWLSEGRVPNDSLVWRQGWSEWQNAGEIFPELENDHPRSSGSAPAISPTEPDTPRFRYAKPKKSPKMMVLLLCVACVVLFSVLLYVISK